MKIIFFAFFLSFLVYWEPRTTKLLRNCFLQEHVTFLCPHCWNAGMCNKYLFSLMLELIFLQTWFIFFLKVGIDSFILDFSWKMIFFVLSIRILIVRKLRELLIMFTCLDFQTCIFQPYRFETCEGLNKPLLTWGGQYTRKVIDLLLRWKPKNLSIGWSRYSKSYLSVTTRLISLLEVSLRFLVVDNHVK